VTNSKDADPGISGLRPSSAYTTVGCDRTDDGRTPRPDEDSARVPIYKRGAVGSVAYSARLLVILMRATQPEDVILMRAKRAEDLLSPHAGHDVGTGSTNGNADWAN